jgi:hypothetical protein
VELAIVLAIIGTLAVVAALAPDKSHRSSPRASTADGIPRAIFDGPAPVRYHFRFARGSTPPPASSLLPANVRVGEMNVRRFATPLPAIDDAWDLIE